MKKRLNLDKHPKLTMKNIKEILSSDKPTFILNIRDLKCYVKVNHDVYDEDDEDRINDIISHMAKNIYIDKTYVNFKGNKFGDAFIVEDKWYEFVRSVVSTNFGRNCDKETSKDIMDCILTIAMVYLYDVAASFDFDPSELDIVFTKNNKFVAEYMYDGRKTWDS